MPSADHVVAHVTSAEVDATSSMGCSSQPSQASEISIMEKVKVRIPEHCEISRRFSNQSLPASPTRSLPSEADERRPRRCSGPSVSVRYVHLCQAILGATVACALIFYELEEHFGRVRTVVSRFSGNTSAMLHGLTAELNATAAEGMGAVAAAAAVDAQVIALEREMRDAAHRLRVFFVCFCAAMTLLWAAAGWVVGSTVSNAMKNISRSMEHLGELNFTGTAGMARGALPSHLTEVRCLDKALHGLSRSIETLARFLPETVVRNIIRGDERAMRPHVSRREVTIMFSDIQDFTTIAESLSQQDLLFVLTRYLSIMTRIVSSFEGVVAEVLGDGLLVFWNSPDDVEDHAAKAAVAAIVQQQALVPLNAELQQYRLPQLAIRIGLHTGVVLSGNIGCETKLKFGCIGDHINLASRMEGLCKFYKVGILCSGGTHSQLPQDSNFFCRELDLVQVKGKHKPTRIYEIMGFASCETVFAKDLSESIGQVVVQSQEALQASSVWGPIMNAVQYASRRFSVASSMATTSYSLSTRTTGGAGSSPRRGGWSPSGSSPSCRLGTSSGSFSGSFFNPTRELIRPVEDHVQIQAQIYERALKAYQEARFPTAWGLVQAFLHDSPTDGAGLLLEQRIREHVGPEGEDVSQLSEAQLDSWTGVRVMSEK